MSTPFSGARMRQKNVFFKFSLLLWVAGMTPSLDGVCMSVAGKLAVLDIAEVNPELGSPDDQVKTLDSCNKIISGWFNNGTRQ